MEFLTPIANLLGVTVSQMLIVAAVIVVLVVVWYVIKTAAKVAQKAFTIGCFSIVAIAAGLWLFFAFFRG